MSDFYSAYQSPPQNNTVVYIIVALVIVTAAVVIFWKYDDIVSLFEGSDNKTSMSASSQSVSSSSSSQSATNTVSLSSSSQAATNTVSSSSNSRATTDTVSSSSISQAATDTVSSSSSSQAARTIQWNDGTRNLGETCETDTDCISSDPYPLVCTEDQSTLLKTCKKPTNINIDTSPCYKYQCNIELLQNLDKKYEGLKSLAHAHYQQPCYKCTYRNWYYPRQHSTYSKQYQIGNTDAFHIPTYEGDTVIDKQAFYNAVCHKNSKNECDPVFNSI